MTPPADAPGNHEIEVLRTSENRYRRLFETARDGILLLNSDTGQIEDVNPYLIEMLGYSYAEFLGKKLWDVGPFSDRAESKEMFAELQAKGYVRYDDLPLKTKAGAEIQVEVVSNSYECEDVKVIQCNIRNITQRKQKEDQVHRLAFYDTLTSLPNRRLLHDRLGQCMAANRRNDRYGATLFLDLNDFKRVNDMHGHEVGDLLLFEAAARLKNCVRAIDTVSRFGGDEFVVVLNELHADKSESEAHARMIAEKIRAVLERPYTLTFQREGKEVVTVEHHCSASIGVALIGKNETSQEHILRRADTAMYEAKNAGLNSIRFYEPMA